MYVNHGTTWHVVSTVEQSCVEWVGVPIFKYLSILRRVVSQDAQLMRARQHETNIISG